MEILLFNNSGLLIRGNDYCTERATGEFAVELESLGHDVTFYGQFLSDVENTTDVFPLLQNGVSVKGLKRRKNKLLNYLSLYFKALPLIYKSDFIYFFYPTSYRFLIFFAVLFRKKYGLYIRGIDDLEKAESKFFYRKAFHIFTVADFFTGFVNKNTGRNVASTIRPMIRFDEHDIVSHRQYTAEPEVLKLLYLGRMTDDKGIIELLQAMHELVRRGHQVELTLVGSGEYFVELRELASKLNLESYTHFAGAVFDEAELKNYYLEADLFVLPSYHEGFPRTLYEAMIFGTPIVTTFVGGISGVMTHNENCLRIEPRSVESIVEKLSYSRTNYAKLITLAEAARQTVRNIFKTRKNSHAEMLNAELKKLEK